MQRVRGEGRPAAGAKASKPAAASGPARVALMLALAHTIQRAIDRGEVRDQAEAARRLGVTPARVSQLLDLTLLAPAIQEAALGLSAAGSERVSERSLREVLRYDAWALQEAVWTAPRKAA